MINRFCYWIALVISVGTVFFSPFVFAEINTLSIQQHTLKAAPSCMKIRQVGVCTFIHPVTGKKKDTPEWSMFLPDLTVATYNQAGDVPWRELKQRHGRSIFDLLAQSIKDTKDSGGPLRTNQGRTITHFKEVGVYGNPMSLVGQTGAPFICPVTTMPEQAYFQSELDAKQWRQATAPKQHTFKRTIGFANHYGLEFPMHGYVTSAVPEWASAVVAQRAVYMVTQGRKRIMPGAHVLRTQSLTCGQRGLDGTASCETFTAEANSPAVAQWQPIYPNASNQCAQFDQGVIDKDLFSLKNVKQSLVFNLWHCYRCCTPAPGMIYIGKQSTLPQGRCAL